MSCFLSKTVSWKYFSSELNHFTAKLSHFESLILLWEQILLWEVPSSVTGGTLRSKHAEHLSRLFVTDVSVTSPFFTVRNSPSGLACPTRGSVPSDACQTRLASSFMHHISFDSEEYWLMRLSLRGCVFSWLLTENLKKCRQWEKWNFTESETMQDVWVSFFGMSVGKARLLLSVMKWLSGVFAAVQFGRVWASYRIWAPDLNLM